MDGKELDRMDRNEIQASFPDDGLCSCPLCGSDYVHLQAVEVNAGGIVTLIDHQHPFVRKGPPWGRGALIRIMMWAECGHSWTRQFYFNKGQTWEEVHETQHEYEKLTDMWRS